MSSTAEKYTTEPAPPHGIEMAGIEAIPRSERHGKPRSLFTLWFGANVQFATLSVGALSTSVFGLEFLPAAFAILVGTLISSSVIGLLSTRGPLTGLPQLIQTRGPFGRLGNLPATLAAVVNGVGWYVVDTILGIFILGSLFGLEFLPSLLIMVIAQLIAPLVGYRMIHSLERILAVLLTVVFAVVTIFAIGNVELHTGVEPFAGTIGAMVLIASVTSARGLGWAAYSSDYSRYLPADTDRRRVFAAATGGSLLSGLWIGILGAALGTVGTVSDPSSMVADFLPTAVGSVVLLSLLFSTVGSTVLDLYSGSMAALAAGFRIPRWVSVVGVTAVGSMCAWWAGQHDFATSFQNFLQVAGYWLAPWAATTIAAFWWCDRNNGSDPRDGAKSDKRFGWGLPATALGVVAAIPFMNQSLFTGPIAAAHPGLGGLGHLVGFIVAAIAYTALSYWKPVSAGR